MFRLYFLIILGIILYIIIYFTSNNSYSKECLYIYLRAHVQVFLYNGLKFAVSV